MHYSKTKQNKSMQIGVYLTTIHSLSADQKTAIIVGEGKAEQRKERKAKQSDKTKSKVSKVKLGERREVRRGKAKE